MKKWVGIIVIAGAIFAVLYYVLIHSANIQSPVGRNLQNIVKPFQKYSFENLRKYQFGASEIKLGGKVDNSIPTTVNSRMFYYSADVALNGKLKKVSGLINTPIEPGKYPVIVMFRGFVPHSIYAPGVGTSHAGEYFAQNGFITLAPDF